MFNSFDEFLNFFFEKYNSAAYELTPVHIVSVYVENSRKSNHVAYNRDSQSGYDQHQSINNSTELCAQNNTNNFSDAVTSVKSIKIL